MNLKKSRISSIYLNFHIEPTPINFVNCKLSPYKLVPENFVNCFHEEIHGRCEVLIEWCLTGFVWDGDSDYD
jgi:hypothetical protein